MKISTRREDRNLTIALHGEIDHHAARRIMEDVDRELDAALPLRTELDMSGVTFMDSSGIAVILRLSRRMGNLGGNLTVTHIPAQARRVLDTAGLERLVTIK
jgi:stage II sporulation protein AA (anti-sigma F factor antagonist)